MPKIYLFAVLTALLLAGCGQATNDVVSLENEAFSPNSASAQPAEAGAAADEQGNMIWMVQFPIPAQYHGDYDRDGAACASPGSEERLRVSSEALRFHESIGEVRGIRPEEDGSILVEADFQGEGERWSNILRLRTGAGGTLVVTQPDGSSLTRIRCP